MATIVINLQAVEGWLGYEIVLNETMTMGGSKTTCRVRAGGEDAVLTWGPEGPTLPTAHDLGREYRFLAVLQGSRVPVPRLLAHCGDPDVAGAPFLLTAAVDGWCLLGEPDVALDAAALAGEAIDVLSELHGVDPSDPRLKPPDGRYLERQIWRWSDQLARTKTSNRLGDLRTLERWLLHQLPPDEERSIVHGDYGFHNLLVTSDRVIAVIDWELATVGDPLADLAFFLKTWGPGALSSNPANDVVSLPPGALSRADLEQRYQTRTGRSFGSHRTFYDVFSLWRSIGIQEGVHARSGGRRLVTEVPAMVATAQSLAGIRPDRPGTPLPSPTGVPAASPTTAEA